MATSGFDHDYLTVWQQCELGGEVVSERDRDHPVRVVGIVYDMDRFADATYLDTEDQYGRHARVVNRPLYVSLAAAKALLDRAAGVDAYERLVALNDVFTQGNAYRLEVI